MHFRGEDTSTNATEQVTWKLDDVGLEHLVHGDRPTAGGVDGWLIVEAQSFLTRWPV
jgi:hypothetical protein